MPLHPRHLALELVEHTTTGELDLPLRPGRGELRQVVRKMLHPGPALLVEAQRARCTVKAFALEVLQQLEDACRPKPTPTTNRPSYPNRSRVRAPRETDFRLPDVAARLAHGWTLAPGALS